MRRPKNPNEELKETKAVPEYPRDAAICPKLFKNTRPSDAPKKYTKK